MSIPPFLDLPSGVTADRIETARGRFAVLRAGDPAAPTALLVPGFTGSKEDFIALLVPLSVAGYSVLALDLGGQYETPATKSGRYSLAGFAADVLSVAGGVSEDPVHLVGHSFGGLVAREAVLAQPLGFASLTLMSSGPAALPADQAARLGLFATVLAEHGPEVVWSAKQALDEQEGVPSPPDPVVARFLTDRFLANDPSSLLAMVEVLRNEPDRVAELAVVAPRALVLCGTDDDTWAPSVQAEMGQRLGAEVAVLGGAGHSPAVDQPSRTAEVLTTFWRG